MAIGVVPFAAMSSSTSFSAFLKSFSAIASRTFCTIVVGGVAAGGAAGACARADGTATIRDKRAAVSEGRECVGHPARIPAK